MKQNNPENKVKKKGTIKQIKATASFFSGVSAIRYFYQQIKFSNQEIWKHHSPVLWAASLSEEKRDQIATKATIEGFSYGVIGGLLFFSSVYQSAVSAHLYQIIFWLFIGLLSGSISLLVLLLNLWKAHMIRTTVPISFFAWVSNKKEEAGKE